MQRDMARKAWHQPNHVPGRVRFDYVRGHGDLRRPSSVHPSPARRTGSLRCAGERQAKSTARRYSDEQGDRRVFDVTGRLRS